MTAGEQTRYHAHVMFRETQDASAEVVAQLFARRSWRLEDVTPGNVFCSTVATEEEARRRLADLTALVAEAGFEELSAVGPITEEELHS